MAEITSGKWNPYSEYVYRQGLGEINLTQHVFNVALLTPSYTPNSNTQTTFADISSHELSVEGYPSGGKPITSKTLTRFDSDNKVNWNCGVIDFGFFEVPSSIKYAVIYDDSHPEDLLVTWCYLDGNEETIETTKIYILFDNGILNFIKV